LPYRGWGVTQCLHYGTGLNIHVWVVVLAVILVHWLSWSWWGAWGERKVLCDHRWLRTAWRLSSGGICKRTCALLDQGFHWIDFTKVCLDQLLRKGKWGVADTGRATAWRHLDKVWDKGLNLLVNLRLHVDL